MDRREFIKKMFVLGLASSNLAGLVSGCRYAGLMVPERDGAKLGGLNRPDALSIPIERPDLVIAGGNEPDALIEKGLQALGGIKTFIKQGSLVVIKPNFSVPQRPEAACTTNPLLVSALVKRCLEAGAREVRVIDHPFTSGVMCLENTEMRRYAGDAGARVYVLGELSDKYYTRVQIGGKQLQTAHFSRDVLDADLFINFPILKHHVLTKLTMGMKNMMGLVWDRGVFHSTDIHQAIADLAAFKKPHLIIMDAIRGIIDNGPTGPGTVRAYNQVIFGFDPVAVDAYGAGLFGLPPGSLGYLQLAAGMHLGQLRWEQLKVVRV